MGVLPPMHAKSIRRLAAGVGRAESTVRKWLEREDWPFGLAPPWRIDQVKAWAEIHLRPDPTIAYRKKAAAVEAGTGEFAGMGPLNKARLQAIIERALLLRHRRLVEEGKVHDAETCQQRRQRQIHDVKSALLGLPRSVAPLVAGRDAEDVERILSDRINNICEEFARG